MGQMEPDHQGRLADEQRDIQLKLAGLQGDIQKTVSEHDTRFAYLHQRRVEVIDKLYKDIVRLNNYLMKYTSPSPYIDPDFSEEPQNKLHLNETKNSIIQFIDYYEENKLYLDQKLIDLLKEYNSQLGVILTYIDLRIEYPELASDKDASQFFQRVDGILKECFPHIKTEIEGKCERYLE
jgi:hypothetical protein